MREREVPPIVHEVLHSPGQPLDPATRAFMEPRFGHDFSQVRVHTDAQAAESALAVGAHAYTVGSHVVFGTGRYAPATSEGQRLVAHELTHVVQHTRWGGAPSQSVSEVSDRSERLAERTAERIISGAAAGGQVGVAEALVSRQSQEKGWSIDPTRSAAPPTTNVLQEFDVDRVKGRKPWNLDQLIKQIAEVLARSREHYIVVVGYYDSSADVSAGVAGAARKAALKRADTVRRALIQWAPKFKGRVRVTTRDRELLLSGELTRRQIGIEWEPVGPALPAGLGRSRFLQPTPTLPDIPKPPPSGPSVEFQPPLTVIVKVENNEIFKVAVPKEAKLSTPPLGGARKIVISMSGNINEGLFKLLKPEEVKPAPQEPGAPAPVEPGPPISAGLSLSVQAGPNVSTKLSGTYDLKTRRLTTGLSFVVTTPYGECALPSGAARAIVDAVEKLKDVGVTSRAEIGGHPMAADPKPPKSRPGPAAPGEAPSIEATDVPEAAVTIGEAVATLYDQMKAIRNATEQCRKGRKSLKVEIGPTLVLPVGEQAPTEPTEPTAPSVGASLKIFFE